MRTRILALLLAALAPAAVSYACPADLNNDQVVDAQDLQIVLQFWAAAGVGLAADLDTDQDVDADDLFAVINGWGPCPPFDTGLFPVAFYPTGAFTGRFVTADFDADGMADLATVCPDTKVLTVLFNDGEGRFDTRSEYNAGLRSSSIVECDIDGDGDHDLITGGRALEIWLNDGAGAFERSGIVLDDAAAQSIAAGDINGDQAVDLAVCDTTYPWTFFILLNDGQGGFDVSSIESPQLATVMLDDLDGDGRADIIARPFGEPTYVWMSDGTADLGDPAVYDDWFVFGTGDVNGDSAPDLVVTMYQPGTFDLQTGVAFNDGTGCFGEPVITMSHEGRGLLGDVDADGDLDVISGDLSMEIALNDGTGSFAPSTPYSMQMDRDAIVIDVDGAGMPELVASIAGGLSVYRSDGQGGFRGNREIFDASSDIAADDFDGDGAIDLAVINWLGVTLLLNDGTSGFDDRQAFVGAPGGRVIDARDMNADGAVDLVVGRGDELVLVLNDGTGQASQVIESPAERAYLYWLETGDFNGDGAFDVAVASTGSPGTWIQLNDGQGGFLPATADVGGFDALATDFDGDGVTDLVTTWSTYLNDGDAAFTPGPSLSRWLTQSWLNTAVVAGDLDGDTDIDVMAAGLYEYTTHGGAPGRLQFVFNDGNGGIARQTFDRLGDHVDAALADLDLDGDLDVLLLSLAPSADSAWTDSGYLAVLFNDGTGAFSNPVDFSIGGRPFRLLVRDFDTDGDPDVAVLLDDGRLKLLENQTISSE